MPPDLREMRLFLCFLNRWLSAETHLGPDGTRLKQNTQATLKQAY